MRTLLEPRWIIGHVLVVVLVVLFVRLGFWQLDRYRQQSAIEQVMEDRLSMDPLPLETWLARHAPGWRSGAEATEGRAGTGADADAAASSEVDADADAAASSEVDADADAEPDPESDAAAEESGADSDADGDAAAPVDPLAYRPAVVTGTFDPEHEILLRNRTYLDQPGWHLLTPLVLDSGGAIIVDRGWVPRSMDDPPVREALPPDGPVTVEGVLMPSVEPPTGRLARFAAQNPADGALERTFFVDVDRLERQMPYRLAPVYLVLVERTPAHVGELPVPGDVPGRDRSPHMSYALQWFVFALIGVVGYALLVRTRLREQAEERS